jgi:amino acid transporter
MSTVRSFVAESGLVRAIGRWSLAALAINSVIGSGVFGLPAIVANLLGRHSSLAALIAAAAIGIIMACFAEVSSRFSEAGGPYLYARAAFGRLIGILVGWFFYLALTTGPAANANLFVIYLGEFWPAVKQPWPRFLILTVLVGLTALINLLGVRQTTAANNVFTVAKILPLLVVIIASGLMIAFRPATISPHALHGGGSSWLRAMALMVFLFGGFESALAPMSEAKNPRHDVAFALFATLIVSAVIYSLIQWVVVEVLGSSATSDRPLAEVARLSLGNPGASLVAVGAMLSVWGFLGAKLLGMPRLTLALAQQHELPPIFCAVSRRFQTPWFSIVFYAAVIWILAIIGSFAWNVTLSVIARLFYYGVICAAVIALRQRRAEPAKFRLPGGAFFPVLGIGICIMLATQVDFSQSRILAGTVAAAILHWAWVRHRLAQSL